MPKIKATKKPDASSKLDFTWIGQYVRHKRTSMGMGLVDAATMCGLSKTAYSNVELGKNSRVDTLFLVLDNLGIRLSVLENNDELWN